MAETVLEARIIWPGLFVALLVAGAGAAKPRPLDALVRVLAQSNDVAVQKDILRGMGDALAGRRSVAAPVGWSAVHRKLSASPDAEVRERVLALSVLFGDPQALALLRKTVEDVKADSSARARALQTLVDKRAEGMAALLAKLLDDPPLARPALRGLAACGDERTPGLILKRYGKFDVAAKADAVGTLSSRPAYALALLDAVEKKQVPRGDLSAFTARQLAGLNDQKVTARLEAVWGSIRPASKDREKLLARYRKVATKDALKKANRSRGRALFEKTCATCHMLFGQGSKIAPDLTGSQRRNPEYILLKVVDPHAVVPHDYQTTRFVLSTGRIITGLVKQEFDKVLVVQTPTDEVRIQKSDIDRRDRQKESLMPEGLLAPLKDGEVRDLLAYLAGEGQVVLPPQK
jgi:putative heme-binding domain-containing protein